MQFEDITVLYVTKLPFGAILFGSLKKKGFIYTGGEFTLPELSVWALFHCSGKDVSLEEPTDGLLLEIKANKQKHICQKDSPPFKKNIRNKIYWNRKQIYWSFCVSQLSLIVLIV